MNMMLLILGVVIIVFSVVLIAISSSRSVEEPEVKEEKYIHSVDTRDKNLFYQNICDEMLDLDSPSEKKDTEDIEIQEDHGVFEEVNNIEIPKEDFNLTEKIIKMNEDGLSANEIAKELNKGVREIEIILKINKIKD